MLNGRVVGSAQSKDGRTAYGSQLLDECRFVLRGNGVTEDDKIEGAFFASMHGRGEIESRLNLVTFAGEHQGSGMQ